MANENNTSGRGQRELRVKVKSAKGRRLGSTRWLERQLNDPYVVRAKAEGDPTAGGLPAYLAAVFPDRLPLSMNMGIMTVSLAETP